jgi:gliding motility-associated-like protein
VDVNVYNRYGSLVFSKKDYQNEWNGTYGSKPLPDGTYYFKARTGNGSSYSSLSSISDRFDWVSYRNTQPTLDGGDD